MGPQNDLITKLGMHACMDREGSFFSAVNSVVNTEMDYDYDGTFFSSRVHDRPTDFIYTTTTRSVECWNEVDFVTAC